MRLMLIFQGGFGSVGKDIALVLVWCCQALRLCVSMRPQESECECVCECVWVWVSVLVWWRPRGGGTVGLAGSFVNAENLSSRSVVIIVIIIIVVVVVVVIIIMTTIVDVHVRKRG